MTTKIVPRSVTWQRILKLEGYLLIPHELLHVVAHRLIGRDCAYQWGDKWVVKREPCSWREDIFCLLFPLMVSLPIGFAPFVIWFATYFYARYPAEQYLWSIICWKQIKNEPIITTNDIIGSCCEPCLCETLNSIRNTNR